MHDRPTAGSVCRNRSLATQRAEDFEENEKKRHGTEGGDRAMARPRNHTKRR